MEKDVFFIMLIKNGWRKMKAKQGFERVSS